MAYAPDQLRRLLGQPGIFQLWLLKNTDAIATVNTAGYITDAGNRGMEVNDLVLALRTDTGAVNFSTVAAITTGAADLTDGLAVGTTNSD
jgi:hypothetical protein